jgi:hypothetical protein
MTQNQKGDKKLREREKNLERERERERVDTLTEFLLSSLQHVLIMAIQRFQNYADGEKIVADISWHFTSWSSMINFEYFKCSDDQY